MGFCKLTDALHAMMQLYPVLNDLMQSMNKVHSLPYPCRKSCLMHALDPRSSYYCCMTMN